MRLKEVKKNTKSTKEVNKERGHKRIKKEETKNLQKKVK